MRNCWQVKTDDKRTRISNESQKLKKIQKGPTNHDINKQEQTPSSPLQATIFSHPIILPSPLCSTQLWQAKPCHFVHRRFHYKDILSIHEFVCYEGLRVLIFCVQFTLDWTGLGWRCGIAVEICYLYETFVLWADRDLSFEISGSLLWGLKDGCLVG